MLDMCSVHLAYIISGADVCLYIHGYQLFTSDVDLSTCMMYGG